MFQFLNFQEIQDLKNELREQKERSINILFNQMTIGASLGITSLNGVRVDSFDNTDNVDMVRTSATYNSSLTSFKTDDGTAKEVITNDFIFYEGTFGNISIYSQKTNENLKVECFVSNESVGENFVQAVKEKQQMTSGQIEEIFKIKLPKNNRVRIKFVIERLDTLNTQGELTKFSMLYQ